MRACEDARPVLVVSGAVTGVLFGWLHGAEVNVAEGTVPPRDEQTLYEALGVGPGASDEDITRAYRRLARSSQADVSPQGHADDFTALTDAYDILRDPGRRRAYDATRSSRAGAAEEAAGMRIPIRRPRGGPGPSSGPDRWSGSPSSAEVELPLTFDQAALGTTAVVELQVPSRCAACDGSGHAAPTPCPDCAGAGHTTRTSDGITIRHICQRCEGAGHRRLGPCPACDGIGETVTTRAVTLRVPPGVDDGAKLRFPLPGDPGRELTAVVRSGGHPYFGRQGRNLTLHLPITLAEAALGAIVTVPTLTSAVAMRVPAGTPDGRTFRIRHRGLPHPDGHGDLLVTVHLDIPAQLNDAQRAALEAFAAATESPRKFLEAPQAEA